MTTFLDGPAQGQTLTLSRAPYFLRAVVNGGKWDALDKLDDEPKPSEMIFVYECVGEPGFAFVDGRDANGRRRGYRCVIASYRYRTNQPPDDVLRDPKKWPEWFYANAPK